MIIGVTGPKGRLGSELVRRGCIPIEADVTDFSELAKALRDVGPDVVIHCAAWTNVDGCENAPMRAAHVNTGGVYVPSEIFRGKIVYISTDYIFDGLDGPYDEDARANPISVYGWSKLGGEIVLKNRNNPNDLIVRTTVLFDRNAGNFVSGVAKSMMIGQPVQITDSLYGSPTYIPHLAHGILAAISEDVSGILNLAGNLVLSRWELARNIAEIVGTESEFTKGPVYGGAPRPLKGGLIIDKAKSLSLPIGGPLDGIKEVVNALEKVAAG